MIAQPISIQNEHDWLSALTGAAAELATMALGLDGLSLGAAVESLPQTTRGGLVAVSSDEGAVHFGVMAETDACHLLSKALMAMEPDEPNLPESDMADAMCEIGNIIAGGVKQRISEKQDHMHLGLPEFSAGIPVISENQVVEAIESKIGQVPAYLIAIYSDKKESV